MLAADATDSDFYVPVYRIRFFSFKSVMNRNKMVHFNI